MKTRASIRITTNKEEEPKFITVDRGKEFRCPYIYEDGRQCNKMFFLGKLGRGTKIEKKCSRCKQHIRIMVM